jgi:predicted Zn-dependent peptidase
VRITKLTLTLALAAAFLPLKAPAQDLKAFEKRVTEFTLPNGMHFIVLERHEAPVVSFHTYVNAGSVDDPKGRTGLAHMFEHMAFKGTDTIGSTNWPAEKKAMDDIERIYDQLDAEEAKLSHADPAKIKALDAQVHEAVEKAASFVVPNLYPRIIEENGGVGMNAGTGEDSTDYFYNFPANRVELWFYLESARFLHPVYREFYKERDVVREERRMRVESDPQGKLMEQMLATALAAHPYRNMPGGWASDIEHLRVRDAEKFFATYYVPGNITMAIVGDVDPARAKALATQYFGRLKQSPLPDPITTEEPEQEGGKTAIVLSPAQPMEFVAYHRPDQNDKDDPVFSVISDLMSSGRTSVMYRDMVRDKKLALAAGAEESFPGGKYPNLFFFYLIPSLNHTAAENEKELDALIANLQSQKVDPEALSRVKTRTRANLIRQLDNNANLAQMLTAYYANFGDWRKLFTELDDIDKVTADDFSASPNNTSLPKTKPWPKPSFHRKQRRPSK